MKPMLLFVWLAAFLFVDASAQAPTPDISIVNTVTDAMSAAANANILPQALMWLGSFMSLQFIITNLGLLKSGTDIEAVFGKLIGSLMWFGFCFYVLKNGPGFIDSVGSGIFNKFAPNIPGPGSIITATLGICSSILIGIAFTGTSIAGIGNSSIAMVLVYVLFVIFSIGMYMAIKVFMLQLELGLIVMLSPLSFSFLGLNALKDQGIAPFKSLIALVYRIILFGIVYSAFGKIIVVSGASLDAISWIDPTQWGRALNTIFSMICAFPMLAYLVYKSDSIASSLAGGSSNMGTGDVASAAAMGAAAGAAIASGGASTIGAASKVPSMGDFMKNLTGGGAIKDASSRGAGSTQLGPSSTPPPSMSRAAGGPATGGSSPAPGKNAGLTVANSSPRPSGNAESLAQMASHASDGVAVAGGSQAASDAAASAALAGGSNEAVSSAVVGAGGTVAQGAAAATAMAVGEAGGSPAAIKAGAQAAGAGKSSAEVGQAVMNSVAPGSAFGEPREVGEAAANASRTRPAQAPDAVAPGSGANAGVERAGSPLEHQLGKLIETLSQQGQAKTPSLSDRMRDVNQHVAQEKAATHVSVNTHHSD